MTSSVSRMWFAIGFRVICSLVSVVVASSSSLTTTTGRTIRRSPLFVEAFSLQPFLIFVPPLLPFDVVVEGEVAEVSPGLVIIISHAHVVPTLETSRSLGQKRLGIMPWWWRIVTQPRDPLLTLYDDLHRVLAVFRNAHVLHIPAVYAPLRHFTESTKREERDFSLSMLWKNTVRFVQLSAPTFLKTVETFYQQEMAYDNFV